MSPVTYTLTGNLATIRMDDGKANVISPVMVAALNSALDQAEKDSKVVVITGREGVFSGGFDLSVLASGMDAAVALVQSGSELARRLLSFSQPVVAASSGHAIAMGAFLLLSCDYRLGVQGEYKYGLNEVAIGMTIHHVGIELARDRLPRHYFNRAVINAEMFTPTSAIEAGFLDQVVATQELQQASQTRAVQLAALNAEAHKNTKGKARKRLLDTIDWAIRQDFEDLKQLMG